MPSIPVEPAAVFGAAWPTTPVRTMTLDAPAGSEMVAEETAEPSGRRIVPKSARTGAAPSSVSTFSLQARTRASMSPSAAPESSIVIRVRTGAAASSMAVAFRLSRLLPMPSRNESAVPAACAYAKVIVTFVSNAAAPANVRRRSAPEVAQAETLSPAPSSPANA